MKFGLQLILLFSLTLLPLAGFCSDPVSVEITKQEDGTYLVVYKTRTADGIQYSRTTTLSRSQINDPSILYRDGFSLNQLMDLGLVTESGAHNFIEQELSNFTPLDDELSTPLHPYQRRQDLIKYATENNLESILDNPAIKELNQKLDFGVLGYKSNPAVDEVKELLESNQDVDPASLLRGKYLTDIADYLESQGYSTDEMLLKNYSAEHRPPNLELESPIDDWDNNLKILSTVKDQSLIISSENCLAKSRIEWLGTMKSEYQNHVERTVNEAKKPDTTASAMGEAKWGIRQLNQIRALDDLYGLENIPCLEGLPIDQIKNTLYEMLDGYLNLADSISSGDIIKHAEEERLADERSGQKDLTREEMIKKMNEGTFGQMQVDRGFAEIHGEVRLLEYYTSQNLKCRPNVLFYKVNSDSGLATKHIKVLYKDLLREQRKEKAVYEGEHYSVYGEKDCLYVVNYCKLQIGQTIESANEKLIATAENNYRKVIELFDQEKLTPLKLSTETASQDRNRKNWDHFLVPLLSYRFLDLSTEQNSEKFTLCPTIQQNGNATPILKTDK